MSAGAGRAEGAGLDAALAEAERALRGGDGAAALAAFEALARDPAGLRDAAPARLVDGLVEAARLAGEPARALAWVEAALPAVAEPPARAALLRGRLALVSRLDPARALELDDEARRACEALGDAEGAAAVLADAAFAGYRRGEVRRCRELAERAVALPCATARGAYHAVRAQIFAAVTAGDLEQQLHLTTKARALARELDRTIDLVIESSNLAETYLELGFPHEARGCAEQADELAAQSGYAAARAAARVLAACAAGEAGDLDAAIDALETLAGEPPAGHPLVALDAACAHAYWLLERGAAGDSARARARAVEGIALAAQTRTEHRLAVLHASLARALAREAEYADARASLELARRVTDRAEPSAQALLVLATAEVLEADELPRRVALTTARTRILRAAARREDPHAFCARVRVHRRLLELTGGVPDDLPGAP